MEHRTGFERWTIAVFGWATVTAIVVPVAARTHAWIGPLVGLLLAAPVPWVARALPPSLDGVWSRRRAASLAWALLATIAVLQMARLSAFMADANREWAATVPEPLSAHHQCLSAYVYAADLSRRGVDNLYDANWYPLFDPPGPTCRLVETPVHGLAPWVSDPYEYPPPFLLLPRAALMLTSSFDTIRSGWFVVQALALVAGGVLIAVWVGAGAGLTIALLLPAVLASLETMFALQFGQFHMMAVMLALAAMILFQARRRAWGGALLAAAILAKVFPAILLIVLAARREWRALGWTAAFGTAYALLGFTILGPRPFVAFVQYQIPRLVSGAAFEFTHLGDHAVFLVSRNFSVAALGSKLALLGAPAAASAALGIVPVIFSLALLALAIRSARAGGSRVDLALVWLGLLDLAALRSPEAPSAYVLAPVLWLLALLATKVRGRWGVAGLVLTWVLVVGPPPLPDRADLLVNLALQGFAVALCMVVVWRVVGAPAVEKVRPPAPDSLVTVAADSSRGASSPSRALPRS